MLNIRPLSIIAALLFGSQSWAAGPITQAVNAPAQAVGNLTARTVNFAATGDNATITVPAWVTAYVVTNIRVTNCSATPVLAQVGLWTAAGGTGTNLVAAGTVTGATSAAIILPMTLAGTVATTRLTAASLFVRITVANATALTCDVNVNIQDLSWERFWCCSRLYGPVTSWRSSIAPALDLDRWCRSGRAVAQRDRAAAVAGAVVPTRSTFRKPATPNTSSYCYGEQHEAIIVWVTRRTDVVQSRHGGRQCRTDHRRVRYYTRNQRYWRWRSVTYGHASRGTYYRRGMEFWYSRKYITGNLE